MGLWAFLKVRKKYWLLPLATLLIAFALLLLAGQGSRDDFVYTLF